MRVATPSESSNEAALARLARQVDGLAYDVKGLTGLTVEVESQRRAISDLTAAVRLSSTAKTSAEIAVPSWVTITDPMEAVPLLGEVAAWVRDVWSAYYAVEACWPLHPAVVADLDATRRVWLAAHAEGAAVADAAAWHDRWAPGTARRLAAHLRACSKDAGTHVAPDGSRGRWDPSYLDEVAESWATSHNVLHLPGLTAITDWNR